MDPLLANKTKDPPELVRHDSHSLQTKTRPSYHQAYLVGSIEKNISEATKQLDQAIANFFGVSDSFVVFVVTQPSHFPGGLFLSVLMCRI